MGPGASCEALASIGWTQVLLLVEGPVKARAVASVVLVGALVAGTTGCTFFTRQVTQEAYDPGDGVSATVGDISIDNALAISDDGENANLILTLSNSGDTTRKVLLQYESDGEKTDVFQFVGAGETVSLGDPEPRIPLNGIGTDPGALLPLYVQYGKETGKTVLVPVLDGSLPEYQDLVPEPAEEE